MLLTFTLAQQKTIKRLMNNTQTTVNKNRIPADCKHLTEKPRWRLVGVLFLKMKITAHTHLI